MTEYHLRRKELAIEDEGRMLDFLERGRYATIAVSKEDEPYLFTADYGFDRESMCIFLHCAKKGKKIDFIGANPVVWGQVIEDLGYVQGECSHCYRTVQFKGKAEFVTDIEGKREALQVMIGQLEDDPDKGKRDLIDQSGLEKVLIIRIGIEEMSGKESLPKKR